MDKVNNKKFSEILLPEVTILETFPFWTFLYALLQRHTNTHTHNFKNKTESCQNSVFQLAWYTY